MGGRKIDSAAEGETQAGRRYFCDRISWSRRALCLCVCSCVCVLIEFLNVCLSLFLSFSMYVQLLPTHVVCRVLSLPGCQHATTTLHTIRITFNLFPLWVLFVVLLSWQNKKWVYLFPKMTVKELKTRKVSMSSGIVGPVYLLLCFFSSVTCQSLSPTKAKCVPCQARLTQSGQAGAWRSQPASRHNSFFFAPQKLEASFLCVHDSGGVERAESCAAEMVERMGSRGGKKVNVFFPSWNS